MINVTCTNVVGSDSCNQINESHDIDKKVAAVSAGDIQSKTINKLVMNLYGAAYNALYFTFINPMDLTYH